MTRSQSAASSSSITLRELIAAVPIVMLVTALREALPARAPRRAVRAAATA
jgi:hypothetical protein